MGKDIPKQFLMLEGKPIIYHTIAAFNQCPQVDSITVAAPSFAVETVKELITPREGFKKNVRVVAGGEQRQHSVANALKSLARDVDIVLVHDGVRPFVSQRLIQDCITEAAQYGSAIAALPAFETVKEVEDGASVLRTLARQNIYLAQTPQVFRREIIEEAFLKAGEEDYLGTDEASLVERLGLTVRVVQGDRWNIKITTQEDLTLGRFYLQTMKKE